MFFFEKKEPKNFCLFGAAQGEAGSRLLTIAWEQDFFASFFQKSRLSFSAKKRRPQGPPSLGRKRPKKRCCRSSIAENSLHRLTDRMQAFCCDAP
jgi:hypothetical protein